MIATISEDWNSPKARVYLFERDSSGWKTLKRMKAVIGKSGMAWGLGLHPPNLVGPQKKEGDLRTPAGAFSIGKSYGYKPPTHFRLGIAYEQSAPGLVCVDDPGSRQYNRIVAQTELHDWTSAEDMRRNDDLYELLFVVEHNKAGRFKEKGSCIFFHIWENSRSATAGCTALSRKNLAFIVNWLDPASNPLIVQLPKDAYRELEAAWNLPHLP